MASSQMNYIIILLLLLLISKTSSLPLIPDPAPVQPSLDLPSSSSPPATIPAFPEQSDATSACPLDLPADLLRHVSHACAATSSSTPLPSRSRCCPALAASLFAAYAATALGAARPIPTAAPYYEFPVLPDDSETCVAGAEEALRARGVHLPRVNGTCGVAYCYCGIRLRRLTCPGTFAVAAGEALEPREEEDARRLERECAVTGLTGCTRCIKALNQLKSRQGNVTGPDGKLAKPGGDRVCQLTGLTWLLSVNRSRYLPAATAVLRTFMAVPDGEAPATCNLSSDDLPLAVGSSQIDGDGSTGTVTLPPSFSASTCLLFPFLMLLYTLV